MTVPRPPGPGTARNIRLLKLFRIARVGVPAVVLTTSLMLAGCRPSEQPAQPAAQVPTGQQLEPAPQARSEPHLQAAPQPLSEQDVRQAGALQGGQPGLLRPAPLLQPPPSPAPAAPRPGEQAAELPPAATAPLSAGTPSPDPGPPPSDAHRLTPPLPVVASAPVCAPLSPGAAATAQSYKRDVACRIHARNVAQLYEGAPPPVLRSIVVLSLRIDAAGRPVRIGVLRSNGIRALERRAIQSVRAAAPLPRPDGRMLKQGSADIVETWLFQDDGRFRVRTLAMVQAASGY